MPQENLEIIGEESIALSLLQPEYPGLILSAAGSIASVESIDSENLIFQEDPIFPEYSIDSKDLIFPEYSIDSEDLIFQEGSMAPEYSIDSEKLIFQEDSIAPQEIDVDPLTGMARNSTFNAFLMRRGIMVRNTGLQIDLFSRDQRSLARVTATIQIEIDPSVMSLIKSRTVDLTLQSNVWGIDGWNGDDRLFNFYNQLITGGGNYTFSAIVPRSVLNEDDSWLDKRDEIAAKFSFASSNSSFPANINKTTRIITGRF